MSDLEELRKIIDECDREIVFAIEKRFETVQQIVQYKKSNNMDIFQPSREKEVLEKVNSYLGNDEFCDELESLYVYIMKLSKQIQEKQ